MGRKILFIVTILVGLGAGLLYGWVLRPAAAADNPLSALSQDYKSDYVLMVAEVYHKDGDLDLANQRLVQLQDVSPVQTASNALVYARQAGYSVDDLELISLLIQGLQNASPAVPTIAVTQMESGTP